MSLKMNSNLEQAKRQQQIQDFFKPPENIAPHITYVAPHSRMMHLATSFGTLTNHQGGLINIGAGSKAHVDMINNEAGAKVRIGFLLI